ncbi:hypothetical protein [Mesorhizobium sp. A623]
MSRRRRIRLAGPQPKRAVAQRIFRDEARKVMVRKVMDVLRGWSLSPFEFEGSAHTGIRVAMILDGHPWGASDLEATLLVREALHLLGAVRPSWIQGQPEYVIAKENCAQCRGPLDDEAIANHDRFCCEECRRIMQTWQNRNYHYAMADRARWAYEVARKEGISERPCAWCRTPFKPYRIEAEACSPSCRENLTRAKLKHRDCANCEEAFRPSKPFQKFCCLECKIEAEAKKGKAERAARLEPRKCRECDEMFEPGSMRNSLCSKRCKDRAYYRRKAMKAEASAFVCEEVKQAA